MSTPCSTNADCGAGEVCGLKSRYITITPTNPVVAGDVPTSIKVTVVSSPLNPLTVGDVWWAGAEQPLNDAPNPARTGAALECTDTPHAQVWTAGLLDLFGAAVVPGAQYEVRHCSTDGATCSAPLVVGTSKWGDVVASFGGSAQPAFGDINAVVTKFTASPSAPNVSRTDLASPGSPGSPNTPDAVVNFVDINLDVSAFQTNAYPYAVPTCP